MLRTRQLTLALAIAAIAAAPAQAQTAPEGISVDGDASRQVQNDAARFNATVEKRRRTAPRALAAAARTTRRVLAAERALGIARTDLTTSSVSVRKVFRRDRTGQRRLAGYAATNRVRVTVRDLATTGRAIDAAVGAGATAIGGLSFFASDTEALYREVLAEAFEDARAKAELLAERAGVTLGRAVFIDEGRDEELFFAARGIAVEDADSRRLGAPTPVRPGRTTVRAFVSVLFSTS